MKKLLVIFAVLTTVQLHADVLRLTLNDAIHPMSRDFIARGLALAAEEHDDAVVLEMTTPGGLLDSTREIVEKLLTSKVPVIVYIGPAGSRAASAGFFILEAGDIAAMAPGTNAGAAHPVLSSGRAMDPVMNTKIENDTAAFMRSIATKRGRNVDVAETVVRQSKSFTEQEALQQKLIDVIAPDVPSLLRAVNGRVIKRYDGTTLTLNTANKPVHSMEMSLKEKILSPLMDPNLAFILLVVGGLALFVEFNHPGTFLPGTIGVIAILLSLFALDLLPTRYAALGLIIAAFALFALEAKFASHGVLGIGGVVCMIFGALFLVDGPIPEMRVKLVTALVVSVPIGLIAVFLTTLVLRTRHNRVATGSEGMIGEIGVARTPVGTAEGKVFVHGEIWNAVAKSEVEAGARVRVAAVNGLHLLVEPEPAVVLDRTGTDGAAAHVH
jgi:membrane-bound serine protease (ClpP class)